MEQKQKSQPSTRWHGKQYPRASSQQQKLGWKNQLAGRGSKKTGATGTTETGGVGQNASGKKTLGWFSNLKKVLFDDKKNTAEEKASKKEEFAQLKKENSIKWL